jgi:threonine aldolase
MRQAGVLASGGIYALEHHVERLADDHHNARRLAEGINDLSGFSVSLQTVQTNIIMVNVEGTGLGEVEVKDRLAEAGVLVHPFGPGHLRLVTHLDVSTEEIDQALTAFEGVAEQTAVTG